MSKNGFSYYKAETDRFLDIKIKRLKKRYGCDGYAVYQYALNEIYRVEGCYIRWTEDQMFDCSDYWTIDEVRVQEVIDYCAEIGLFDTLIWKNQGILTARSIQNRYLDICKVSKKKIYIPMEIMLVEPQQEMKRPEPLPLFDATTEGQSASGMNGKNKSDEERNAPTVVSGTFRNTTETFRNTPECSGKFPEKIDKEKKSKENPSSVPPACSGVLSEEEAKRIVSSAMAIPSGTNNENGGKAEEKPRNVQGLLAALKPFNLTSPELEEVLQLSGHGELGNPVWAIIAEIRTSKRIKMPRLFLLSRLRGAVGLVVSSKAHAS